MSARSWISAGAAGVLFLSLPVMAGADNLYRHDNWAAMATDRHADKVGDVLTVVIMENADASNTAQNNSQKGTHVQGQLGVGSFNKGAQLGLDGRYDGVGQTARSGKMVAQITVTVEQVLPNGDLRVAGAQNLNINGEKTYIKLRGRVRPADVRDNSVLSSRIADAEIAYGGSGFVTRSTKPGIVTRVFRFLGVL